MAAGRRRRRWPATRSWRCRCSCRTRLAARLLRERRAEEGALDFDRTEVKPVLVDGVVTELRSEEPNRARDLIESFMVAANGATARFCRRAAIRQSGASSARRERWPRIVELASAYGVDAAARPRRQALEAVPDRSGLRRPDDFADLSLSVIKLLGRGEYVAELPPAPSGGHFALAVTNYTHSTAPNRRFPDLVTQRLLKAALAQTAPAPYRFAEYRPGGALHQAGGRRQQGRASRAQGGGGAVDVEPHRQEFDGIVTGASPKGTWVRLRQPTVEGRRRTGAARTRRRRSRARPAAEHRSGSGIHRLRARLNQLASQRSQTVQSIQQLQH